MAFHAALISDGPAWSSGTVHRDEPGGGQRPLHQARPQELLRNLPRLNSRMRAALGIGFAT